MQLEPSRLQLLMDTRSRRLGTGIYVLMYLQHWDSFNNRPYKTIQQSFDVALHGMRLNMKGALAANEREQHTDEKSKSVSALSVTMRMHEYCQRYDGALHAASLVVPLLACLLYLGFYPASCLYERAWCGVVMIVIPSSLHTLLSPLRLHAGILVGVGLVTLISTASTVWKDCMCMLVLSACSMHAYVMYCVQHASTRRCDRIVAVLVVSMLVLMCALAAELWHALSTVVMSAVLVSFVALYVVCLLLLKSA